MMHNETKYSEKRIKILFLAASPITGTYRVMLDIIENIDIKSFQIFVAYKPELLIWNDEELKPLRSNRVKIFELRGEKIFDFKGIAGLANIIRQESFDIIHCWDSLGLLARPIGKMFGCKIIQSYCNTPDRTATSFSLKYFANWVTSFFLDGIIFCTEEVKKSNMAHNFIFWKRQTISVIHNCANAEKAQDINQDIIRKKYSLSPGEKVLINIGFFNEQKGHIYLLHCFKRVLKSFQKTRLIIIGWGPLESHLKKIANQIGIERHILFTGKLSHHEVFELLSISDIFVLSSLWEGFGIVLTEAMACGIPVVSTDTDGSREVVENGKTGIIVPPKSPKALADAIINLLGDPIKMKRMGMLGKNRVEDFFSPEEFIQKHEKIYTNLVKKADHT